MRVCAPSLFPTLFSGLEFVRVRVNESMRLNGAQGCPMPSYFATSSKRGFALILSLGLMSLMVLLLLTLSALVQVEVGVSDQNKSLQMARQNALVGLNVAVGQLQRCLGPDQRSSAPADIAGDENALPDPQSGTRYWTGVFGNRNESDNSKRSRALLNWLVSGNDSVSFSAVTSGSSFGKISTVSAPRYVPSTPITPALAAGVGASSALKMGTTSARLLVGPGTLGPDAADVAGYVVAPLVPLYGDGSTFSTGAYAYWVGDEGLKARVNFASPYAKGESDTGSRDEQLAWSFGMAQSVAADKMTGLSDFPSSLESPSGQLEKLSVPAQVPLMVTADAVEAKKRYHDLTMRSQGVLSDSRHGGLKRDLTRILENGGGGTDEADGRFIFPNSGGSYGPSSGNFYSNPPTWGRLRDFAQYQSSTSAALSPQTPTTTRGGIAPVMVLVTMDYSLAVVNATASPGQQSLEIYVSPRVTLWNPYNRVLKGGTYEFGFQPPRQGDATDPCGVVTFTVEHWAPDGSVASADNYYFNAASGNFENPLTLDRKFFRFRINVGDLQPGEAAIFLLSSGGVQAYSEGNNTLARAANKHTYAYPIYGRVRIASLLIPKGDHAGFAMRFQNSGEVNAYLGEPGAGASAPSGAVSPGGGTPFYQWIGRVGLTTPVGGANAADNKAYSQDASFDLPTGANLSAAPRALAAMEIFHTVGIGGVYTPLVPTRWIAAYNPRAYMNMRTGMESAGEGKLTINPQYFGLMYNYSNVSPGRTCAVPVRDNPNRVGEAAFGNDYNNTSYGSDSAPYTGRFVRPTLFQFPSREEILFSVADLRHAPTGSHVTSPAYPIGNSLADFRVGLGRVNTNASSGYGDPVGGSAFGPVSLQLYDHSFLLNDALWDRYFFSTITASGALPATLPNSRLRLLKENGALPERADVADAVGLKAASRLMLEGSFNVNSTSVEAWRAVLGAMNKLRYNPEDPTDKNADPLQNPFSRLRTAMSGSERQTRSGSKVANAQQHYSGYRELTDEELDGIAERMAEQVRLRGPFLSVAEFVNRNPYADDDALRLRGAIQSAIDNDQGTRNRNDSSRVNFMTESSASDGGGRHLSAYVDQYGYGTAFSSDYDRKAYVGWNGTDISLVNNPFTRSNYFVPGDVTQADVLAAIGATLAARSDTFVIRAYGESFGKDGNVEGQAWCEAVVQRLPQYLDSADTPETQPSALTSAINRQMGRRFVIIAFRWLSPDEI